MLFSSSETDAYMEEHIQKEHDAKYKCKVGDCAKAFKGMSFVEKHIMTKHGEEVQRIKDEVTFYNNYVCDPNHLLPASANNNTAAATSNGATMNTGPGNATITNAPFMMNMSPLSMGSWDQIPRIGFGGNVGWPTSMAGRVARGPVAPQSSDSRYCLSSLNHSV